MNPDETSPREDQVRRSRSVRRGVVAAGATGALGAAIAIGTTIHASGATAPTVADDEGTDQGYGQGFGQRQQPPSSQGGQLAAPGGNGPVQGRSGGS